MREAGVRGGVGCLVRVLAQSEYGKGDQQQGPTVIDETVVVTLDGAERTLTAADGVIVEEGPPSQIFGDPREERTKQFLSQILH